MRFRFPTSPSSVANLAGKSSPGAHTGAALETRQSSDAEAAHEASEKEAGVSASAVDSIAEVDREVQHGVQAAQAMTMVWTTKQLIMAYIMIWCVELMITFSSGITSTLTPYVTSSFGEHSLLAVTSVASSLFGGLVKLPFAKLITIWGRPQGFALMVASMTLGTIMMAGCQNVQTYCAAQVFYYVGSNGIDFVMTIFVADTSSLRNRAFMIAFYASPYLASTWAYGPATNAILDTIGFRWDFGIWTIIIPVVTAPLWWLFYYNQKLAEKKGLIPKVESGRTFRESFFYYCKEFDVIGLILLGAGLALILLALSIYSYQADEWKSPMIISFFVFGGILTIAFGLWEKYWAPVSFVPWYILKDRTIVFTYIMASSLYLPWYIWDSYFYSFCIVVWNVSITNATYIGNIYTIGSCFWSLVLGVGLRYYGKLKIWALVFGVPLTILGVALQIIFRQPDVNIGYIVMCQIFIAYGGGTLVICEQMTVMAIAGQQHLPSALALESAIIYVASGVGSAIASAMWTSIFPAKLAMYLPADAQADLATIYGDITVQSGYPVGSPTRDGINKAYGETQKLMLIAATSFYSVTLVSTLLWKNIDTRKMSKALRGQHLL